MRDNLFRLGQNIKFVRQSYFAINTSIKLRFSDAFEILKIKWPFV